MKTLFQLALLSLSLGLSNPIHGQESLWQPTGGPADEVVQSLLVAQDGDLFAATMRDGIYRSTDNGSSWFQVNEGLEFLDVRSLTGKPSGRIYAGTGDGDVYYSDNDGARWIPTAFTGLWETYTVLTQEPNVLFAAGDDGICRSDNNGNTWEVLDIGMPLPVIVSTMADLGDGVLLAGSLGMGAMRSSDNGSTWSQTFIGSPDNVIRSFTVDPGRGVFAATSLGVFISIDRGVMWEELPDPPGANVVDFAISGSGTYFAATSSRVYNSADNGITWNDGNPGLEDLLVSDLLPDGSGQMLAGTNGSGVFRSTLVTGIRPEDGLHPAEFRLDQNYPNPFNPSTSIRFEIGSAEQVTLKIYDIRGREVMTLVNEKLPAGTYSKNFDAAGFPSGIYFYQLRTGSFEATKAMVLLK